jgi:hypothetical protein
MVVAAMRKVIYLALLGTSFALPEQVHLSYSNNPDVMNVQVSSALQKKRIKKVVYLPTTTSFTPLHCLWLVVKSF